MEHAEHTLIQFCNRIEKLSFVVCSSGKGFGIKSGEQRKHKFRKETGVLALILEKVND